VGCGFGNGAACAPATTALSNSLPLPKRPPTQYKHNRGNGKRNGKRFKKPKWKPWCSLTLKALC
jgi:hypothetical protein